VAQVPAAAAGAGLSAAATQALTFAVNLGASYLLSRLAAQDGPRLDNLAATGGEYGVAMPRAYGEATRLAGIFLAQADIKEKRHTVEDYSELIGAATGALEGFMLGGPVGAAIGAGVGLALGFLMPDQHYYTYSDTMALLLCDRVGQQPIEGVTKIYAAGKLIFSAAESAVVAQTLDGDGKLVKRTYGKNRFFKSMTIYGGSTLQGVDPVLATALSENGAYPFLAYAVIEDLQLKQFGNSVPACEFLASIAAGQTLADIAGEIAAAAGIDVEGNLSTTLLSDDLVRGYSVAQESSCWDGLKPLLPAFGVTAAEVSGQIRFGKRSKALRATIPTSDMGAHAAGDSAPQKYTFERSADIALPKETSLTFIDPARDYLPNTATARRSEGDARSNVTASVTLVLTADEGASAAALMLWDAWLGRTALSATLTDKWLGLSVGLAYAIPVGPNGPGQSTQYVPYRITRRTRGANGLIEFEAVSDEAVTYAAAAPGASGGLPEDEPTAFADTRLMLMDAAILSDGHDDFGFYVAMAGSADYWERGAVRVSGDGGAHWATLIDSPQSCPAMGDVTGTLAAGTTTGLDDTLDTVSVLTVELLHDGMTLSSCTDAQLDANVNFAFVGKNGMGEYVQFKTATQIGPTTWDLTNLRRGRRGSDWAIGTHSSGEEFALLGGEGVFRIVYSDAAKWGEDFEFRGVSLHQDDSDAPIVHFTNTGEGKRPYSPYPVHGTWDGSNNVTIDWTRRARLDSGGFGANDLNNYEVEITSGAGRTITATAATSAVYTAAQQTTDGLTPGDSISGRVRQLSTANNGRWRNFTLIGPTARRADSNLITADDTVDTADMG
jgi:hypothetical protein